MDTQKGLEDLYREAVALVDRHYHIPRLPFVKDPVTAAGDWVKDHPGEARDLAKQLYELLSNYFSRS